VRPGELTMDPRRQFFAALLSASLLAACSSGGTERTPQASEILPRRTHNTVDTRLVIKGKNMWPTDRKAGDKQAKIKVLLWAGTVERLERSISLYDVRATSDTALSARLRAGSYPGSYRVVLQTGKSTVFTDAYLTIVAMDRELGTPKVSRVEGAIFSDVPGRIYLSGENLLTAQEVRLRTEQGVDVATLTRLRQYNSARLGASLAAGLVQPGTYRLAVSNRWGWSQGPKLEVKRSGYDDEAGLCFSVYFGVLGAVFVIGCVLAGLQGDLTLRKRWGRRNLIMLLSGFVFYLVLLGAVQFFLAWWS